MKVWHQERNAPKPGTEICDIKDSKPGDVHEVSFAEDSKYPYHIFVYNDDGQHRCYLNRCPHFGIKLNLRPGKILSSNGSQFLCCHHLARFNIEDGLCVDGPPQGLSLESIPIVIKENKVYVDDIKN